MRAGNSSWMAKKGCKHQGKNNPKSYSKRYSKPLKTLKSCFSGSSAPQRHMLSLSGSHEPLLDEGFRIALQHRLYITMVAGFRFGTNSDAK